jgi:ABC-type nitrate/sulfonate/bicarbonate transport system substrate-binding protein
VLRRCRALLWAFAVLAAAALRAWVGSHGALLERYIAAYVESLRWVRRPENQAECAAILMDKLKIDRDVAERTYRLLVDPIRGFTPDAAFDTEGFRNLLALRAEIEGDGTAARAEKYVDLSYYRRAIGTLAK